MIWVEIVASFCGLLCVWLTVRQNIWCWPVGLIQVLLFIGIFYHARLYSDVILHVIYVFMQFYGWYHWLHGGQQQTELQVSALTPRSLLGWGLLAVASTVCWGYAMANYTDAAAPYADAFIAAASLIAQWLLACKKLEAWYFWITVDLVAVVVYCLKNLYITTGLYSVFLVLAVIGFVQWKRTMPTCGTPEPAVTGAAS